MYHIVDYLKDGITLPFALPEMFPVLTEDCRKTVPISWTIGLVLHQ
jgi:hypothetical protein